MPLLHTINGFPPGEFEKRFCIHCNARCCKVGVWIPLLRDEFPKMQELARKLGRDVKLSMEPMGNDVVWVMSHGRKEGEEPCGFLDTETNKCLIYEDRPQHCKDFYCEIGFTHVKPNSFNRKAF